MAKDDDLGSDLVGERAHGSDTLPHKDESGSVVYDEGSNQMDQLESPANSDNAEIGTTDISDTEKADAQVDSQLNEDDQQASEGRKRCLSESPAPVRRKKRRFIGECGLHGCTCRWVKGLNFFDYFDTDIFDDPNRARHNDDDSDSECDDDSDMESDILDSSDENENWEEYFDKWPFALGTIAQKQIEFNKEIEKSGFVRLNYKSDCLMARLKKGHREWRASELNMDNDVPLRKANGFALYPLLDDDPGSEDDDDEDSYIRGYNHYALFQNLREEISFHRPSRFVVRKRKVRRRIARNNDLESVIPTIKRLIERRVNKERARLLSDELNKEVFRTMEDVKRELVIYYKKQIKDTITYSWSFDIDEYGRLDQSSFYQDYYVWARPLFSHVGFLRKIHNLLGDVGAERRARSSVHKRIHRRSRSVGHGDLPAIWMSMYRAEDILNSEDWEEEIIAPNPYPDLETLSGTILY